MDEKQKHFQHMADLLADIAEALKGGGLNKSSVHLGERKTYRLLAKNAAAKADKMLVAESKQ